MEWLRAFSKCTRRNADTQRFIRELYSLFHDRAFSYDSVAEGTRVTIPQPGATRWSSLHRSITAFLALKDSLADAVEAYFARGRPEIPGFEAFVSGWSPTRISFFVELEKILKSIAKSLKYLEGHISLLLSLTPLINRTNLPHLVQGSGVRVRSQVQLLELDALKNSSILSYFFD